MRDLVPTGAWTGGQWSVVRALLGLYVAIHFVHLTPYAGELFSSAGVFVGDASPFFRIVPSPLWIGDTHAIATSMAVLGATCGVLIGVGLRDRVAALVAWWILACFLARNPLISNPSLPYVGLLLLVHAAMPRAPYGSMEARGRIDPTGGWRPNRGAWLALWTSLAVGYSYSAWTKLVSPSWIDGTAVGRVLENPLARTGPLRDFVAGLPDWMLTAQTYAALAAELLFLPLALWSRTRPWIWLALLAMHLGLVALIDFADLSLAMALVHVATFDPAWVHSKSGGKEVLFYDGSCGLCHRAVRFVLAEDTDGTRFTFAPLFGETFDAHVSAERRASLPDSLVVRATDGRILVRSDAALHVLERLGGLWRALATMARVAPRPIRDALYDGIAKVRKRLFAAPKDVCPLLPPAFRGRFQA